MKIIREKIVDKDWFQNTMIIVIILSSISMGIATIGVVKEKASSFFNVLEYIYLTLFIIEAILKILAYGYKYFLDAWNIFDLVIIIISAIPSATNLSTLRTLRIFKAFRTLKLASKIPKLKVIIESIALSGKSIFFIFIIMILVFYTFALVGVSYFGKEFPSKFGTLPKALYSLFVVITLEGLASQYARPIKEKFSGAELYFVIFSIIVSFILINVIVGIVSQAISRVKNKEREKIKVKKLEEQMENLEYSEIEKLLKDELERTKESIYSLKKAHQKFINEQI